MPWLPFVSAERLPGADTAGRRALARAIGACAALPDEADVAAEVRQAAGADWLLLSLGGAKIAGVVLDVAGAGRPVAFAIMTGSRAVSPVRSGVLA